MEINPTTPPVSITANPGKPADAGKPKLTGLANAATRVKNPTALAAIARNVARKGTQPDHHVTDGDNHTKVIPNA